MRDAEAAYLESEMGIDCICHEGGMEKLQFQNGKGARLLEKSSMDRTLELT